MHPKSLILTQIWVYPVKSLGGISLQSCQLTERGLLHDRRWILIDLQGKMLTQRQVPTMTLFKTTILENGIGVEHAGESIVIPFTSIETQQKQVQVWDDTVMVQHVSVELDAWFTKALGQPCGLYYQPDTSIRSVDVDYAFKGEHTSLADGFPVLIAGEASLRDLNTRLEKPVEMLRFRPNLIFEGGEPYEEDSWGHFSINDAEFFGSKPCARCPMPTIDLQTAEFGKEPMKTLATYRRKNNKVYFGQNALVKKTGMIHVGDHILL